jgi:threonine/homoserine/homoserine lactone efflux protein
MGFVTNLLNPKITMRYLVLLPQFIDPARSSLLTESLALGSFHIIISVSVNAIIALVVGSISAYHGNRSNWLLVERCLMAPRSPCLRLTA